MKRVFDIFCSLAGLVLLSPVFLLAAVLIKSNSPGGVFFVQKRLGKNFRAFDLYKFRTMRADATMSGPPCTSVGDDRVTSIGRFLRKTKIDELPQLWNVLWGDMSLVGPRPEVPKYVEMFREEYDEILKVKPGITDFAAIEFKDEEKILGKYSDPEDGYIKEVLPRKIELYKKYVKKRSLSTDMKLVFLTLWKIVTG